VRRSQGIPISIFVTVHRVTKSDALQTTNCKRLQGAADARRRLRGRPIVLQVPDNKADAVPCACLPYFNALMPYKDFPASREGFDHLISANEIVWKLSMRLG